MIFSIFYFYIFLLSHLMQLLDNTFFGTLFAGLILAFLALYLYKEQKKLDIKYNHKANLKKNIKEFYINIDTLYRIYKNYNIIFDISDIKIQSLYEYLEKHNSYSNKIEEKINNNIIEIDKNYEYLISNLSFDGIDFNGDKFNDLITKYKLYIISISYLRSYDKERRDEMLKEITIIRNDILNYLKEIFDKN